MKRIYPVMVILFFALIALAVLFAGAQASLLWSVPALLMVVLLSFVLSLCSFSPAEIGRAFALAFRRSEADQDEVRLAILYFRSLQWYLFAAGFIGLLVGVITILGNLHSATSAGTGAAISLLTLFYALALAAIVAVPFRTGLERKLKSA